MLLFCTLNSIAVYSSAFNLFTQVYGSIAEVNKVFLYLHSAIISKFKLFFIFTGPYVLYDSNTFVGSDSS